MSIVFSELVSRLYLVSLQNMFLSFAIITNIGSISSILITRVNGKVAKLNAVFSHILIRAIIFWTICLNNLMENGWG